MFLELNSKGLYQSSGKEKESCCLVFPSSTRREIRHFHVVVVQRRQRNVQKSTISIRVQDCYFVNLNLLVYCRSRCSRRLRFLSSHATTTAAAVPTPAVARHPETASKKPTNLRDSYNGKKNGVT